MVAEQSSGGGVTEAADADSGSGDAADGEDTGDTESALDGAEMHGDWDRATRDRVNAGLFLLAALGIGAIAISRGTLPTTPAAVAGLGVAAVLVSATQLPTVRDRVPFAALAGMLVFLALVAGLAYLSRRGSNSLASLVVFIAIPYLVVKVVNRYRS